MSQKKPSTRLIHTRGPRLDPPTVNPPIERGSTVLFNDPDELYAAKPSYGRMGLGVHRELEALLVDLESADTVRLTPNGLSACALAISSILEAGDHALVQDSLYGPTRRFCERRLSAMGVSVTRFDPRISPDALKVLIEPNTRAIVLESPGSLTFELPDTRAIADLAKRAGLTTVMDNTWGVGLFHKPLELGIDISVQALTKYAVGHADAFGGAVMTNDQGLAAKIAACSEDWGLCLAPDDAYLAVRGLRTLETRLARHEETGVLLAEWLEDQSAVASVIHPALPSHPDHEIWKRDFSGACGLFSFVLQPVSQAQIKTLLQSLDLFAMGFSWGGYESLIIPCDEQLNRTVTNSKPNGPLLRVHAGLEDPEDLIADLEQALATLT